MSISRGVYIYTRDKFQLRHNVCRLGEEKLALDFIPEGAIEQARIISKPKRDVKKARERATRAACAKQFKEKKLAAINKTNQQQR